MSGNRQFHIIFLGSHPLGNVFFKIIRSSLLLTTKTLSFFIVFSFNLSYNKICFRMFVFMCNNKSVCQIVWAWRGIISVVQARNKTLHKYAVDLTEKCLHVLASQRCSVHPPLISSRFFIFFDGATSRQRVLIHGGMLALYSENQRQHISDSTHHSHVNQN